MTPDNCYHRPMIPLALSLALGIVAGDLCGHGHVAAIFLALLSAGALLYCLRTRTTPRVWPLLLMGSLGFLSMQPWTAPRLPADHISLFSGASPQAITGRILTSPRRRGYRTSFALRVESTGTIPSPRPAEGTLRVTVSGNFPAIECGDRIHFSGRVRRIRSFHNPGGFDYSRYMSQRGILVSTWTRSGSLRILEKGAAGALSRWIDRRRKSATKLIDGHASPRAASVLRALLIGDRSGISTELRTAFNRTGAAHLLAISGLHIGIVAGSAFFLFSFLLSWLPLFLWRGWGARTAAFVTLLPVWYYGLLAGMAPSTTRALVMVSVCLVAVGTGKLVDPFNTLALAAFVLLLLQPPAIFSVSFQLSFAAVLAILAGVKTFGDPEADPSGRGSHLVHRITLFALVSLFAFAGTLPLCMHYFHLVSLVSLPVNLLLVPVIGMVVVPLGLFSLFTSQLLPTVGVLGIGTAAVILDMVIGILSTVAKLPWTAVATFSPTPLEIALYWLLAGALLVWRYNHNASWRDEMVFPEPPHRRRAQVAGLVAATVMVAAVLDGTWWLWRRFGQSHLQITCIDVGQGSAALLELPGGAVLLVDGGGFSDNAVFDVGHRILAPLLRRKKIATVDLVVLSHPNSDHLNGLIHILRHFTIGCVWTNGQATDTNGYRRFVAAIEARDIPMPPPGVIPQQTVINGVHLYPLFPYGTSPATEGVDANNASLVLKVEHGHIGFLFPGDIEKPAEIRLQEMAVHRLPSTILAAPHHGSSSSSTTGFLKQVSPECIIISAGYRNRYNMPHPAVLKRYRALAAAIYRTDRHGAIVIRSDGRRYRVQPRLLPRHPSADF